MCTVLCRPCSKYLQMLASAWQPCLVPGIVHTYAPPIAAKRTSMLLLLLLLVPGHGWWAHQGLLHSCPWVLQHLPALKGRPLAVVVA